MTPDKEQLVYLNRKKYDVIVGIDPDATKSGVAVLERNNDNSVKVDILPFPELVATLCHMNNECAANGLKFVVVVEAGWMESKSNFHPYQGRRAENIAKDVGRNHETGRKIIEMMDFAGIDNIALHPLVKSWRGSDGKITHEEITQFISGLGKRSNQEERDAALIAWHFAELPIAMKPIR